MDTYDRIETLVVSLGFTQLEAAIYGFLLKQSPATGYKIAKGIRRSFTNTYKALESLARKGAVVTDRNSVSLYQAIRVDELLRNVEKGFKQTSEELLQVVSRLPIEPDDKGIYHLATANQVYEKADQLLNGSEERVLLELFPIPFNRLSGKIRETAKRNVRICARVYNHETLDEIHLIHSPYGQDNIRHWNASWLALFIDGKRFLLAHLALEDEGVYDAIWSANPFLARAMYSYVNSDLHFYTMLSNLKDGEVFTQKAPWFAELQNLFPVGGDLGYRELSRYFKST